ncbi:hypothetical protein BX600DRAFT_515398 [Xylariales sp. PMI_506]|nr:hypothetical protein BX600DRAFT_515398 [Xylariales sp. PMI_506]
MTPRFQIQKTTAADLDAITDLSILALRDDPASPYRFPNAERYPDEHRNNSFQPLPPDDDDRIDGNMGRMIQFRDTIKKATETYFSKYDKQLSLLILATLPKYRRQGAVSMLVEWGKERLIGSAA